MALNVGQKAIAPAVLGSIGMGGYSAYDKYANGNMYADPIQAATTGAMIGGVIGAVGVSGQVMNGVSKKVSQFTNPSGASQASLKLFNSFT